MLCVFMQEMPGHEDYVSLSRLIIPLALNYCQCMLELEEYYEVIEHTTELLEKHTGTVHKTTGACEGQFSSLSKCHCVIFSMDCV